MKVGNISKIVTGSKFKMAAAAVLNFVFGHEFGVIEYSDGISTV